MDIVLYLALGLTIGSLSGAFGIGGGVLLVPAAMWLLKANQRQASGMTLAVLAVPVTLPAVWQYYSQDLISRKDLEAAAWMAGAFAAGTYGGAYVQAYLPLAVLRLVFGLLMMYVAARFLVSSSSEAVNAAAGLSAVTMAWLAYLGLRLLGRRHLTRPDLGERIRGSEQQGRGHVDYHI